MFEKIPVRGGGIAGKTGKIGPSVFLVFLFLVLGSLFLVLGSLFLVLGSLLGGQDEDYEI